MAEETKAPVATTETKAPETVNKTTVDSVVAEIATQSAENQKKGKENVKISLIDKFNVEFTKDFRLFKKGDSAEVSELAKEFYVKKGVAKVVK